MTSIDLDERLVRLLEHRDFFEDGEDATVTVEDDDIVLDVVILARVKAPEDVGSGDSGLVIISQNDTDNIMLTGMLHRAVAIDSQDGYVLRGDDD